MNKPLLIVVTGRPASGKSTLSEILAREINFPLISRDTLKAGYINTIGAEHAQLDDFAAMHIYDTFFEVIGSLISKKIPVIVEAAFQNHLWQPLLLPLQDVADIRIVICDITPDLAKARFADRRLNDPTRDRFHGDNLLVEKGGIHTDTFEHLNMDVPILKVDTTGRYSPDIQQILGFINKRD
jgi:predicted kinase